MLQPQGNNGQTGKVHLRRSCSGALCACLLAALPIGNGFTLPSKRTFLATTLIPWKESKVFSPYQSKVGNVSSSTYVTSLGSSFPIFPHSDTTFCLSVLLLLNTFGISLERHTVIGKALSAPLATMALALILANVGVIPFVSPVYTAINHYIVPLAVPLLLFDSDLRRVVRDTGSLLLCFATGAVATVVGTLAAFWILPMHQQHAWKVSSALAARHIGGAINFVAVAETLDIPGTLVSAAIAADNVVVALYFCLLFALAKAETFTSTTNATSNEPEKVVRIDSELDYAIVPDSEDNTSASKGEISLNTISVAIATAASLVTVGKVLTRLLLPGGKTSALPLTSALTVFAATAFPEYFARLRDSGTALGIFGVQLFFAASGAAGSIRLVLQEAPSLFAFSILQIAIHFGFLIAVGRGILRLKPNELYLASNANVGGPTTAAAMAQAKGWKRLVVPALLVGILGYATATAIALALSPILFRMSCLV